jgi:1-acyl-sn-glycerol-3-phosphate acyltransferase
MSFLYRFFFTRLGWTIEGAWPKDKKYIIVVAPHTSNWDFMVGLCVRSMTGLKSAYLAKKELFRFPLGPLFRSLGGVPVERSKNTNFVDTVAQIFIDNDSFVVAITPEGKRKYNPHWKTGFFYIAQKASVPMVPTAIDYPNKRVVIGPPMSVGGDVTTFVSELKSWFLPYKGKNPEWGPKPNE